MAVRVDRMTMADVPEVMAIERDSFLTPWPGSAYKRELGENRNAHYLVLRIDQPQEGSGGPSTTEHPAQAQERRSFWSQFFSLNRAREIAPAPPSQQHLAGYAGLWLMVDEAHITTIAVRPQFRGHGFGELLLVALAEIAHDINARWLTLEVRVSNSVAQSLYRKYGFRPAGIRQRYYSDNQEDALIMWTDEIRSPEWQERFTDLRARIRRRLVAAGDLAGDVSDRTAPTGL
jgi:ribosomal-protein-alanine N-acetyltransferase